MFDRIVTTTGTALLLALIAVPAYAQLAPPTGVPEPATVSLFAVGAAGAYLAKRFRGRK